MSASATLSVAPRSERGKSAARTLRRNGRIPAVIYGHGDETRELSIDALELERLIAHISIENTLIDLQVEGGEPVRALIRDVQWHPYKPQVLHVDFYQIHAGEAIKLDVPVRLVGTPVGVSEQGGVLQQVLHALHIECLPRNIPDVLEIDIAHLNIGDVVYVRDVQIPDVTIHNDGDLSIASVAGPTVAALPEAPTTEADVEPELVRKPGEEADDIPATEQAG
jgi:large subunit ribosomal protein L25